MVMKTISMCYQNIRCFIGGLFKKPRLSLGQRKGIDDCCVLKDYLMSNLKIPTPQNTLSISYGILILLHPNFTLSLRCQALILALKLSIAELYIDHSSRAVKVEVWTQ